MWWDLALIWGSILLPVAAGFWQFKRLDSTSRVFLYFCVFSLFFDVFNTYIGEVYKDNRWVFKAFLVCDLLFFIWYYHKVFARPLWSIWINVVFAFGLIAVEFLSSWFPGLNDYANWYHFLMFLFFIIQSAYAILTAFSAYEDNIFRHPVLWISFGRLFYFLLIVFIFVYPKLIFKIMSNELIIQLGHYINIFANICMYILYGIGFLCLRTKKSY